MKKLLFALLVTWSFAAQAQVYNNEWIDYSKTYFKFKLGKTGLCRINQSVLAASGVNTTAAEQFQLWRNGIQVPIFTSVSSGPLSATDYIEFWGEMNDGKPDRKLYRDTAWQLNDKWSLSTDTATYFLTLNPIVSSNLRLQTEINNVSGTTLPVEPWFMYTLGQYFKSKMNPGYAVNVGEYLYSSSYDKGEGWTSADLTTTFPSGIPAYGTNSLTYNNLFVATGGPAPQIRINVSGNAINPRRFKVTINNDSVAGKTVDYFNFARDTANFALTTLASNSATVVVTNLTNCSPGFCPNSDRLVVHQYEITYPRQFNFGGASNFEFSLAASGAGNYLQISNFNYGAAVPVLYDLTNGKRYNADLSSAPVLKFVLAPSATNRKLVLVSEEGLNISYIGGLETRNFINYTAAPNQGDYLIISNPILFTGAGGANPVDEYRQYRSSIAGGGYTAKVYLEHELIDQFGFGIKKHPIAIRNFIRYAKANYPVAPRQIFIIGKGVNYVHQRTFETASDIDRLNLVPTFGWPASDVLMAATPGSSLPDIPVGRLSAVTAVEVANYLKKVKDFELAQVTYSPLISNKGWMKNVIHSVGAGDPGLDSLLTNFMKGYANTIRDTLFGGKVTSFSKSSSDAVQQLNNTLLQSLFNDGISLITYFGHSSATTLEFNLDNPENYNNIGKYPLFIGLGCNAGNFFNYNQVRFQTKETLSEKWVLAQDRGTIGFIASTHFGIVHYLDIWNSRAYRHIANKSYGKTIGEIMKLTSEDVFAFTTQDDFYARCNTEQSELHGDPAIRMNPHPKPDYAIEDPMLRITPGFVSVADPTFRVDAKILNLGRAIKTDLVVEIKRTFPNGTTSVYRDTIPGVRFADSIAVDIPINPNQDKGQNIITVTVDPDNLVDELFESNNTVTKNVMIYEDEARPVYPYNFAIINKQNIKLTASTANPFSPSKQYRMELDTTELFNSPLKVTRTVTTAGGVMEFDAGISFTDSTVYYWRVAPVPLTGSPVWNTASFTYLPNSDLGFNQSHVFQHFKSGYQKLFLDSASRRWRFGTSNQTLFIRTGTWVTSASQEVNFSISINSGPASIHNTCYFQSVVFNVFDPVTFKPIPNVTQNNTPPVGLGLYGSAANNCFAGRAYNFEYRWDTDVNRKKAMDFMNNNIPNGAYVVVRTFLLDPNTYPSYAPMLKYAADWEADTLVYGSGQSLYHSLKNAGFNQIDSFNKPRQFVFVYKKGDPTFTPKWVFTGGTYDVASLSVDCPTIDTIGFMNSPQFGPAKKWKELRWRGNSLDTGPDDHPTVDVIGIRPTGVQDTLITNLNLGQQTVDISSINAAQYPFLQLRMKNLDSTSFTPYQLRYWRLTYIPAPEGAIAPNVYFQMKDTLDVAEPLNFKIAFKNISESGFDSLKVKMVITDRNNVQHVLPVQKHRPLPTSDTLHIRFPADTRQLVGANALYVEVNPDDDQPEQFHFNNFAYKPFYVRGDTLNPLLDVTFDNVHILNRDIVSSKPNIQIRLKDEAKWFLLDNASTMTVKVKYPDGTIKPFAFNNDTLQFFAAAQAPNNDNTAMAMFRPYFPEDGDYELIVSGNDMSQNNAGTMEYRVAFQVINKPMISNMLNYPNPFTTSTAFVFTVTGSEVPQNIRIQILTVTGKIVREITKQELGPIHIGRNITEFKWDGTDQYGQKLGNGVYLYRVITNLNGKALDKYTSDADNTDKYFNKGYGKMYLMR